jgi:Holliday junction resolvase RusA-like endonuclease
VSTAVADGAAVFQLQREMANVETIAQFTIMGEPVSKARARFTRGGGTYTPAKTRTAEEAVAWHFRSAAPGHQADAESTYGLFAIFFAGTRQRRDVDNMIKLVCDGLNKVAWADDVQVVEVSGRRGLDAKENARTEVWVYRIGRVPDKPSAACVRCGTRFRTYDSWSTKPTGKKYCTPECFQASVSERRVSNCANCGNAISNRCSHKRKYCSEVCELNATTVTFKCVQCQRAVKKPKSQRPTAELCDDADCRRTYWNARRKTAARGQCSTCGGPTSKKTYTNCRACAPAAKRVAK